MYSTPIMCWALSLLLKPLKAEGDEEEVQQQLRYNKCSRYHETWKGALSLPGMLPKH